MLPYLETEQETIEYLNKCLREYFGLWVVSDAQGWHEEMSLDYFDNPYDAFIAAFTYGVANLSGFEGDGRQRDS